MSAFSNYLKAQVANVTLRNTPYTPAATLYLALYISDPTDTGTAGTEASYTGYARVSMGASPFTAVDATGMTQNANVVTFPANGNSSGSPVIAYWGILDALTGGNMLYHGALTTSKTIDPSDVPSFPANSLKITFA